MALKEWNAVVGTDKISITKNDSVTAVAGGATTLGGTTAIRLLIDDAVAPSKNEVIRELTAIVQRITEDTWPPA